MYYQSYEDYMRQVLGYPINDPNIYENYDYRNNQIYSNTYYPNQCQNNMQESEILSYYPEIYHKIYPMVCKVCDSCTQPINKELIQKMTDEVYNVIENSDTIVNVRIQTNNEKNNAIQNKTRVDNIKKDDVQRETRQSNFLLKDLITILILNRIFGNNRPPYRPPFPGNPGRPPFQNF